MMRDGRSKGGSSPLTSSSGPRVGTNVPDQLSRSRDDAGRARRRGHARILRSAFGRSAFREWLMAGRPDLREGEGVLGQPLSSGRQPRPHDRLSAVGYAGCRGRRTVLPQGPRATPHRQSAHHRRSTGTRLIQDEKRRRGGGFPGRARSSTSTTPSSRIIGRSSGWRAPGSAWAGCEPRDGPWQAMKFSQHWRTRHASSDIRHRGSVDIAACSSPSGLSFRVQEREITANASR
jgi:hypothetical protein